MAVLIAGELLTIKFSMHTLSGARALVAGDGFWTKGQKNAAISLEHFGLTLDEADYRSFLDHLKIPEGDHRARVELAKSNPDMSIIREGFLQGNTDPHDVQPIVDLLQRFSWVSYIAHAQTIWAKADELIVQFKDAGEKYHHSLIMGNTEGIKSNLEQIKILNEQLTFLELQFSEVLGTGSRWLEYFIMSLLFVAVFLVEGVGLSLTYLTGRSIYRGLKKLNQAAGKIEKCDYSETLTSVSKDEIGQLTRALNNMRLGLRGCHENLEEQVQSRTLEITKLAQDNAMLYEKAKAALQTRDEFLSTASHELRTPLTGLLLNLQMLTRSLRGSFQDLNRKQITDLSENATMAAKRLTTLLNALLDLTRLRAGKLELNPEKCDMVPLVQGLVSQLKAEASRAGSEITVHADFPVFGNFDPMRVGQVITNLVSNAIKYGDGKPIDVFVKSIGDHASVGVRDHGIGIPEEQQSRIFERFERGENDLGVQGLGLGLFITKQIVSAHGGSIKVESKPGQGSHFEVEIGSP